MVWDTLIDLIRQRGVWVFFAQKKVVFFARTKTKFFYFVQKRLKITWWIQSGKQRTRCCPYQVRMSEKRIRFLTPCLNRAMRWEQNVMEEIGLFYMRNGTFFLIDFRIGEFFFHTKSKLIGIWSQSYIATTPGTHLGVANRFKSSNLIVQHRLARMIQKIANPKKGPKPASHEILSVCMLLFRTCYDATNIHSDPFEAKKVFESIDIPTNESWCFDGKNPVTIRSLP